MTLACTCTCRTAWCDVHQAVPATVTGRSELGVVVAALLARAESPGYWARPLAAEHGWDLGDVVDTAEARTNPKWTYFSGLAHLDDRHTCDVCAQPTHAVDDFTTGGFDPSHAHVLACGHTVI